MIFNKIKWFLGISMVFFLIVATNLIDRQNFREVRDTALGIYDDRLLTKNVLFKLSMLTHEKALANARMNINYYNGRNKEVDRLIWEQIDAFHEAGLNPKEAKIIERLETALKKMEQLEMKYVENPDSMDRTIIESHGGRISVESVPGRTAFTVVLPAE